MEYKINILGEFQGDEVEKIFSDGEIHKGMKLIRYMILYSSLGFLLIGILELFFKKDINVLIVLFTARIVVFALGSILFYATKRVRSCKTISIAIYAFATIIYIVYFCLAFYSRPLEILSPMFFVILLSTCLLMMPIRWIVNLCFSLVFSVLFLILYPYICKAVLLQYRIIAFTYLFWNIAIINVLFYNINIYKRNNYAKALQLEALANTDQLTKIHNRKSCDTIIEDKCAGNTTFSIIMFDIDDFKRINDTYGHVAGDDVLIDITEFARRIIRKDDIIARWGGEEFVIIMLDATLSEATELAKRLKEQLTVTEHKGINQIITCSYGVTAFSEGDSVKSIIKRADQLLYLAKEYGKNRVVAG